MRPYTFSMDIELRNDQIPHNFFDRQFLDMGPRTRMSAHVRLRGETLHTALMTRSVTAIIANSLDTILHHHGFSNQKP